MLSAQGRDPPAARESVGRLAVTGAEQIFSLAWNPVRATPIDRPRPISIFSQAPLHERRAPAAARPSPQGAQAANLPARIRQARPAMRRRGGIPFPLFPVPSP